MAVTTDVQGLGIGRKLEHCMKSRKGKPDQKLLFIQQKTARHFFV
jgi:hypothetical protein